MTKTCLGSDPESEVCLRKAGSYPKLKPRAPGCSFPFFSAAKTAVTLSYSFHPLRAKTIYTIPAAKGREVCDVLHTPNSKGSRGQFPLAVFLVVRVGFRPVPMLIPNFQFLIFDFQFILPGLLAPFALLAAVAFMKGSTNNEASRLSTIRDSGSYLPSPDSSRLERIRRAAVPG